MKAELQNKILHEFPWMFVHAYDSMNMPFHPICFGIECGDGWYALVHDLCEIISNYCRNCTEDNIREFRRINKWKRLVFWAKDMLKPKHLRFKPSHLRVQVSVLQIKEKFGGLRFYYNVQGKCDYRFIDGAVDFAENLSYNTCEYCGTTSDKVGMTEGWVCVICEDCQNKQENKLRWKLKER